MVRKILHMVNSSMIREIGEGRDESRLTELARKLEVVLTRVQGEEYAMASREARMKAVDAEIDEVKRDFGELQNAMASLARVVDELNIGARLNEQELRVEEARRELKEKMNAVAELLDLVKNNSRKMRELEETSLNIKVILGQLNELSQGVQGLIDHFKDSEESISELRSDVDSLKKLAGSLPEAAAAHVMVVQEGEVHEAVEAKQAPAVTTSTTSMTEMAAAPAPRPVPAPPLQPQPPVWARLRDDINSRVRTAHGLLASGKFDDARKAYDSVLLLSRDFDIACTERSERDAMNVTLRGLYDALVSTAKAKGKK